MILVLENSEGDDKRDLDEDEGQLDPEARREDAVVPVVDSKSLVFRTDEDSRDNVAGACGCWLAIYLHIRARADWTYIKTTSIAV